MRTESDPAAVGKQLQKLGPELLQKKLKLDCGGDSGQHRGWSWGVGMD